jgi:hypothetical protein
MGAMMDDEEEKCLEKEAIRVEAVQEDVVVVLASLLALANARMKRMCDSDHRTL